MASSAASTPSTTPSPITDRNGDQSDASDGHQEPGEEAPVMRPVASAGDRVSHSSRAPEWQDLSQRREGLRWT